MSIKIIINWDTFAQIKDESELVASESLRNLTLKEKKLKQETSEPY